MKTPARGARTHNLPKSSQTRHLLRHIVAERDVLKDGNYETPRGSLNMRIAYLPIHLFRCVDERQVGIYSIKALDGIELVQCRVF